MIIVHYEVYVLEGRGWMLHARFPRMERDSALAEAKELENTLKIKVRVVRETYYTDNNAFEEAEIYITGGKIPDRPIPQGTKPRPGGGGGGGGALGGNKPVGMGRALRVVAATRGKKPIPAPGRSKAPDVDLTRARQTLGRLLAIVALGLAASLLAIKATPNIILALWKMGVPIRVDVDTYQQTLLAVFAMVFLMVSVPLAMRFLPRKSQAGLRPVVAAAPPRQTMDRQMKKSLAKLAKKADKTDDAADEDDLPPLDLGLDDPKPAPDPEEPPPQGETLSGIEVLEQQRVAAEEKAASTQSLEAQIPKVSRFLDGAMEQCRQERIGMDNYNRFALHLYMAGAVESLAEFRKLGSKAAEPLMKDALDVLGTRGETARNFHLKLPEYRREPRYKMVIEAGRSAMGNYLLGDEMGAHIALRDVFREWNRKVDQSQGQMMTVLFTDMVDSTNMTQMRGDAAAQEIVRRHNLIVRNALGRFGGNEVKHTGDGIMASFLDAGGAIDAMIQVQRQVAEHNSRMPAQSLHLRIGMNAGEPIQEEDDLFGSTVQLAARVCAATGTDEIYCTQSVMDLAGRPGSLFRSVGAKAVKGFRDPVTMYEILWK